MTQRCWPSRSLVSMPRRAIRGVIPDLIAAVLLTCADLRQQVSDQPI
jgi:hypothetical protein